MTDLAAKASEGAQPVSDFAPLHLPRRLAIPVIGAESADSISAKAQGTEVERGEPVLDRWPESSAVPLASARGRIAGMTTREWRAGRGVPAVLFEPDETQIIAPWIPARPEEIAAMLERIKGMDLPAAIEQLGRRGVWADSWKSPDLLAQLRACLRTPVDTIICNVLDEDPAVPLQSRVGAAFAVEVAAGALTLAALTRAQRAWAVVSAWGSGEQSAGLAGAATGTPLKLVPLRNDYPQAHPTLLIHELTGRHARPGRLPVESGVLVLDVVAAAAVGRCFLNDEPMLTVPVGVRDHGGGRTHFVLAPVGMQLSDVLAQLEISPHQSDWRGGNPLRERRVGPATVLGGADASFTIAPAPPARNPDPCIRCAWCVEGCPVRIQPAGLLDAAQQDDRGVAREYGLDACIECGICSYVCPSHLPLLASIRKLRGSGNEGRE
ncbi:MAG TPA: 4Fe-4S dicluster domain-containing protein [Tepidisphaeraceae bacterium]|nr:4Fe-4S dicluster domain-containing protein [Tepidisphaeraceae bacterium]